MTSRGPRRACARVRLGAGAARGLGGFPWEVDRTAKVGKKKVFAFLGSEGEPGDDYRISLKLPESAEQALVLACCEPTGYGLGRANWVTIRVGAPDCPPVEVLLDWVEESYRTIAPKTVDRAAAAERRALPPAARGALAILLNPGAWLFLAAVASPLFAAATQRGRTTAALLVTVALVIGAAIGDGAMVLLGGLGVRRAGDRIGLWVGGPWRACSPPWACGCWSACGPAGRPRDRSDGR